MTVSTNKILMAGWATVGALVALSIGAIIATARAQETPLPPMPGSDVRTASGAGRLGPMSGGASVAATEKYVYVVRGGTLYQYRAEGGLRLQAQTHLPAPAAGKK